MYEVPRNEKPWVYYHYYVNVKANETKINYHHGKKFFCVFYEISSYFTT